MKTKITQNIKATVLGLIIALSVGYATAWTGPTAQPANNNVSAPINVGSIGQIKLGSLTVGGLGVLGDFTFVPKVGAVITDGQVLVADGTTGKVKWGTVSSNVGDTYNTNVTDGSGVTKITAGTGISVTPASGVGTVTVGLSGAKKPIYICSRQDSFSIPSGSQTYNNATQSLPSLANVGSCDGNLSSYSTCYWVINHASGPSASVISPCTLVGYIVN